MNNVKNKNNVYVYYHAKKNIKCTLKFCRKYKNWTAEDWLLFIHTAMNKEWNQNFLQEQLLPTTKDQFGDGSGHFFQHDGGTISKGKSDNEVARRSLHLNFGSVASQLCGDACAKQI